MGALVAIGGVRRSEQRAPATGAPEPASAIARIHKSRCGACHVRVEPGERTRAELEAALSRHRKRVHLTDDQWSEMIAYLAVK